MSLSKTAARNRANAKHSTGPKTPEGKAASSQNARTHGLSGKLALKNQADAERFQARIAELTRHYKLTDPLAPSLIEHLVTAEFRMAQAFATEQAVRTQLKLRLLEELDHQPTEDELEGLMYLRDAETTRVLPQLHRHYVAADRSWQKYYKLLAELKASESPEIHSPDLSKLMTPGDLAYLVQSLQNEPAEELDAAIRASAARCKDAAPGKVPR